jgi:hypothetical protein
MMVQIPNGEARFYHGVLILCQSYHGNYECSYVVVGMSACDGMDSSTYVPVVRCAWVLVAMSYHVRH